MQIAANAQKLGIMPVYLDSESALDQVFLKRIGCNLDDFLYIQATSVESVLEFIEELLKTNKQYLFIWDSLANTPTVSDIEGNFNPIASLAMKARILSKGFSKLNIPLSESQSTLLILNQLKTQITKPDGASPDPKYWTIDQKWTTPGGKSTCYNYSLRIWLTQPKKVDDFVLDNKGFRVGSSVRATLIKSRFGSQGRKCEFKILWGEKIGIMDEQSLFEAIQSSPYLEIGAWNTLRYSDGTEIKFRENDFSLVHMKEKKFRDRVMELLEQEVILKFDRRETEAINFL